MSTLRVAHRYASALMALTNEQKKADVISGDLLIVKNALDASHELQRVLKSPIVSKDKKKAILAEVFKKTGDLVQHYIGAIVTKGREDILHEILTQYFILLDEKLGIVRVKVKTSVDFSSKQEKDLQKQLEVMTKKKIEATFSVDTSLRGGFIARVGDTVLDGSITRQLEILKKKLKEGSLNN
ncbi:MAG: ATP synthase F1 subunit delta [Bacteroidota bacterium]|nr:ATP synthase F1 subunit delta [Bacteroidota bacterium]